MRYRIVVRGDVQGVGYRASCRRVAEQLGVAGTVRNLPDGSVEVIAEGDAAAVDRLVEWCREGPAYGRVTATVVDPEEPAGLTDFRVTY